MIIFESGGGKNLILVLLVVLVTGIIAWQWIASDPFSSVEKNNIFLPQIQEELAKPIVEIKKSIDQGTEEAKNLNNELAKQAKQEQLIEEAKKYLKNKEEILEGIGCLDIKTFEECSKRPDCLAVDYCSCITETRWYEQCKIEQTEICDCFNGYFWGCEELNCGSQNYSHPDIN